MPLGSGIAAQMRRRSRCGAGKTVTIATFVATLSPTRRLVKGTGIGIGVSIGIYIGIGICICIGMCIDIGIDAVWYTRPPRQEAHEAYAFAHAYAYAHAYLYAYAYVYVRTYRYTRASC